MEIRILGPVEVDLDGRRVALGPKQQALLAVLALEQGRVVSTDRIVDALYGSHPPQNALKTLHVHVSRLRKALAESTLETTPAGYRLSAEGVEVDASQFERLAENGRRELAAGYAKAASRALGDALLLWRGLPLADFSYADFAQAEIARLSERRLGALEDRIDADLALGLHATLVGELEALVHEHPLRERLTEQLMLALYRSGRQADALAAFQRARTALVEELGIDPARSLRDLERAILQQDPALESPIAPAPPAPVEAPASSPAATTTAHSSAPESPKSRKTVTAITAAISPASEARVSLDPEALRRVTATVFTQVADAVTAHGGSVQSVSAEEMSAVFGIPEVHEDDAVRAIRAASDVHNRLAHVGPDQLGDPGFKLDVRVGISTGEVVAGGALGAELLVTAAPFVKAGRLAHAADVGGTLIDATTVRLVGNRLEGEPTMIDGRSAFRLERLMESAAAREKRGAPMVGRERELRRVRDAYEQIVNDRSCLLFTVLGLAGVGKSRLIAEFLAHVEASACIVRGRCLPYGEGITYWPLLEAVRDATDLDESHLPEEALARLRTPLEGDDEADFVVERLGELIGLSEGSSSTDETFAAVRMWLEALARTRPVVLVFDDIHWAEPTFLDLVDHVTVWVRDAPILLVCLARPELLESRGDWGGGKLNATTLLLEPLSEAESRELVENLADGGDFDEATLAGIFEAADGNPLFLEEMLAFLAERTEPDAAFEIPPTIHALLAARLDRLPHDERVVLEAASIEGKVFHESSVAAMLERKPAAIGSHVHALVRKDLVRPGRGVFSGERGYRFRHILIRDAAYESVPKELRSTMHERQAQWLEARAGERSVEFDEILGYHLEQAYRYRVEIVPVDATALTLAHAAGTRIGTAGRRALARGDAPAAVKLLARAASLLPPDDVLRIHVVPGVRSVQGMAEDLAWADEVLEEALDATDEGLRLHARVQRALLRLFTHDAVDVGELVTTAQESIRAFEDLGDELGQARSWRLLQQARYLERQSAASADAAEHALLHARRTNDPVEEGEVLAWLGVSFFMGSTPAPEAERRVRAQLADARGSRLAEALLLGPLSSLVAMQGRFDEAHAVKAQAGRILDELGYFSQQLAAVPFNMGATELLAGDLGAAERLFRAALAPLEAIRDTSNYCAIAAQLARTLYEAGRYAEAEELTHRSEEASRLNDVFAQITWREVRAKAIARRGDLSEAERLAREATSFAEASDFFNAHADALLGFAEVLVLAGRPADASTRVEAAITLYERKGNVVSAGRARAFAARLGDAAAPRA